MKYTDEECRKLINEFRKEMGVIDNSSGQTFVDMLEERLEPTDQECFEYFTKTAKEMGGGWGRREARMCEEAAVMFEDRINKRNRP